MNKGNDAGKTAEAAPVKRLYSLKELASHFGATIWWWRTQVWSARLPFVRVGRKILIDRKDVEEFIRLNKFSN